MKKITNIILGFTVIMLLLTSCGADSDVLSQFSKRKYLKRSKAAKQYELAQVKEVKNESVGQLNIAAVSTQESTKRNSTHAENVVEVAELKKDERARLANETAVQFSNQLLKDWGAYNRPFVNNAVLPGTKVTTKAHSNQFQSSQEVSEVVIAILCIFLPPLAVYLYEDSITTNFWVDLVATILFWFPGMILAFLICFAGVSFG